jgi:3-oxoacyl-(acyl-carrier-protein) synthase
MKIYIRSTGNISPQHSLDADAFFLTRVSPSKNYFKAIEPDYDVFIDSKMIRRMSRIVKMGVAAAITCLRNGGMETPAAILTATAYGCLEDTSSFLRRMIEFEEKLLSPTAFIQSTHNTVGAQIALLIKCHNYNNTIVHRAFSFENALTEAGLLLAEGMGPVLLGAVDEITADSHVILSRFGLYKQTDKNAGPACGNIDGEGASFFLLDKEPGNNPQAIIRDLRILYKPENIEQVRISLLDFLEINGLSPERVGLVLSSHTGNAERDASDKDLLDSVFPGRPFFPFKSLCGDYPTASGFALWLGTILLKEQKQPAWMKGLQFPLNNIFIHHCSGNTHHSFFLIGSC